MSLFCDQPGDEYFEPLNFDHDSRRGKPPAYDWRRICDCEREVGDLPDSDQVDPPTNDDEEDTNG